MMMEWQVRLRLLESPLFSLAELHKRQVKWPPILFHELRRV